MDRVARRDLRALRDRTCAAETSGSAWSRVHEPLRLFRSAVDRVDEIELLHAEVVVGARLDRELFDGDAVVSRPGLAIDTLGA